MDELKEILESWDIKSKNDVLVLEVWNKNDLLKELVKSILDN